MQLLSNGLSLIIKKMSFQYFPHVGPLRSMCGRGERVNATLGPIFCPLLYILFVAHDDACTTDMQEKAKVRLREPAAAGSRDSRNLAFTFSFVSVYRLRLRLRLGTYDVARIWKRLTCPVRQYAVRSAFPYPGDILVPALYVHTTEMAKNDCKFC